MINIKTQSRDLLWLHKSRKSRSFPSAKCLHCESSDVTNSTSVRASRPHRSAAEGPPKEGDGKRRLWGKEQKRTEYIFFLFHLYPSLSGCHILFVSRGRLCGNGDVAGGSLAWLASRENIGSMEHWSVLALEKEKSRRIRIHQEMERVKREEGRRWGGMHPFSHVFDMEVFPTGVKKGRADWAEWAQLWTHTHTQACFSHLGELAYTVLTYC